MFCHHGTCMAYGLISVGIWDYCADHVDLYRKKEAKTWQDISVLKQ